MVGFEIPLGVGRTMAHVNGNLDPSFPLVVLLHGFGGSKDDMMDPIRQYGTFAFNRNAVYPPATARGWALFPPPVPVHSFFLDPLETSLTSWMQALTAAGFSTITYTQSGPTPPPDVVQLVAQLAALATGPLSNDSRLSGLRIAFVAYSRGGIVARSFLASARTDPALAGFLSRVSSLVTLHSPNLGIGLANIVVGIDALLAAFAGMSVSAPDWLTRLRGLTHDPAFAELAVGSTVLAGIAAREPVPGISYHTFGGTSTAFARLWANVYLPSVPIPLPPGFFTATSPMLIGVPLDAASFIPVAVLSGIPEVVTTVAAINALASTSPELRNGTGDLIVTDARARLPFATSHTTNALNHAEVLWNPTVQAQVVAILLDLRAAAVGTVNIRLRANNGQYVCANDGGGGRVVADRVVAGVWETFQLVDQNGPSLRSGDPVVLRASNGQLVCAEGGGGREVVANRNAIGRWETFKIMRADGSGGEIANGQQVALGASNGQFVCAEGGGGREVVANRSAIGAWETFTIEIV